MKPIAQTILVITMLLAALPGFAGSEQDYVIVTFVKGEASDGNHKPIKVGDHLHSHSKVIFKTKDDLIVVLGLQYGRVKIQPGPVTGPANELVSLILDVNNLKAETKVLGTRGDKASVPHDLDWALTPDVSVNPKLLITSDNKYQYDKLGYPTDADRYFILQLQAADGTLVNTKLATVGDTLLLTLANFEFGRSYHLTDQDKIYLGYFDRQANSVKPIHLLDPHLDLEGQAPAMVKTIYEAYRNRDRNQMLAEIDTELYTYLGRPNPLWIEEQIRELDQHTHPQ